METVTSSQVTTAADTAVINSIRNAVADSSDVSRQMGAVTFPTGNLQADPTNIQTNQPTFFQQLGSLNDRVAASAAGASAVQTVVQQHPPQPSASSSTVVALLQQDNGAQHQRSQQNLPSPTGTTPRSNFGRSDMFAKPVVSN